MGLKKTLVFCCLIGLLILGVASATAFVKSTAIEYGGACDSLDGVPGLLQSSGFVPRGTCPKPGDPDHLNAGDSDHDIDCNRGPCEVHGKDGHCVKNLVHKKHYCQCVPNKISR